MDRITEEEYEELLSVCCTAPSLGEIDETLGICSECKEHAIFEVLEEMYDKHDDWTRNKKVPEIKF